MKLGDSVLMEQKSDPNSLPQSLRAKGFQKVEIPSVVELFLAHGGRSIGGSSPLHNAREIFDSGRIIRKGGPGGSSTRREAMSSDG